MGRAMRCTHLSLVNFRNYLRLELDLEAGVTVLVGDNAQGKSNLLEALFVLATTKSFRASAERELINWGALAESPAYARIGARVERASGPLRLEILIREDERRFDPLSPQEAMATVTKRIKVNGVQRRAIDTLGLVNVVLFSPQDIDLVQGSPQVRRRYLDVTIAQTDRRYCRALAHYNKVLLQRNHLLRQIRERHARADQLFVWDQELVRTGAFITWQRWRAVNALHRLAHAIHRDLADQQELLAVHYRASIALPTPWPEGPAEAVVSALATRFQEQLERARDRELAQGVSLVGPHRDDLAFTVDGRPLNLYGSRGQQRTVALAMKLAEAAYMREQTGEPPILLLDDLMSELDETRRRRVLAALAPDQQVILTTTDLEALTPDFLAAATVLRVTRGLVSRPAAALAGG